MKSIELPEISIIIPVYNVEPYIRACINSVISQTYNGSMECIIIDDCGQDKSISIAEDLISAYTGNISFKVIHHDKNRGLSAARNSGLDNASGKYVFFLDSDDEITPTCIELLSNEILNDECDCVVGGYEIVGNRRLSGSGKGANKLITDRKECFRAFLKYDIYVMAWNKLISKDFLIENKLYFREGLLYEDVLWSFYMSLCISSAILVREITYKYRIRPNSITSNIDENKFQHQIRIFNEKVDIIDSKQLFSQIPELKGHILLEMSSLMQLSLSKRFSIANMKLLRRKIRLKHIICSNIKLRSWIFAVALVLAPFPMIPYLYKLKNFICNLYYYRNKKIR